MLSQFSFCNFRSYKNETVFDFEATTAEEMCDSIISDAADGKKFLPVSVIYGPNGGGKSNLIRAFICMVSTVAHPILLMEKAITSIDSMYSEVCHPFLFDEISRNEPTDFEVYFRIEDVDFRYALSIHDGRITDESLFRRSVGVKKPTKLFSREGNHVTRGNILTKSKVSVEVNEKMPYLSFLATTYRIPQIDEAAKWFESCILQNYAVPLADMITRIVEQPEHKKLFLSVLHGVDACIQDYEPIYDSEQKPKGLLVIREINGKRYSLPLEDESDGTRKMFQLLPVFINSLTGGKLLVVDEMDAKLHPTLLRYLISLYHNPCVNTRGAQLWFTSHDLTTMKNDVFRRDEIWFSYRDAEESSRVYSLYDIRTPKNAHIDVKSAYDKQYLEGRYGADPYFVKMLDWRQEP